MCQRCYPGKWDGQKGRVDSEIRYEEMQCNESNLKGGKSITRELSKWLGIRNSDQALGHTVVRECGHLRQYSPHLKCIHESPINTKQYCVVLSVVVFLTMTLTMLAGTTCWCLRIFLLLTISSRPCSWFLPVRLLKFNVGSHNLLCCCGCKRRPSKDSYTSFYTTQIVSFLYTGSTCLIVVPWFGARILRTLIVKGAVFWDKTSCNFGGVYWHLRGSCSLHHQGR